MTAQDMADHLEGYRHSFDAPVHTGTEVLAVTPTGSGHVVETTEGRWSCRALVVATGAAGTPRVPALAQSMPRGLTQLTADEYRRPDQVGDRPVLVVGASASGVQIADELRRAGRRVILAVGEHLRLPRRYRGRDIHWWMDALGILAQRWDTIGDLERARRLPSPQLIGTPDGRDVDLPALHAAGADLVGRLVGLDEQGFTFSGSLAQACTAADLKLNRLLDRIDDFATACGLDEALPPAERQPPTPRIATTTALDRSGVGTVIWATGYRTTYPWLDPRLLTRRGTIRHDGGVMSAPGAYCLGLTVGRRRSSSSSTASVPMPASSAATSRPGSPPGAGLPRSPGPRRTARSCSPPPPAVASTPAPRLRSPPGSAPPAGSARRSRPPRAAAGRRR